MKKILTLFTMLAVLVSVVSAQSGPKINCQAVVRHHDAENNIDTLYHDQTVDVTITVLENESPVFMETHLGLETTENGLVTIPIGWGDDQMNSLLDVDWSHEAYIVVWIDLGIDGEDPISFLSPVRAMPYAIQANIGPITTEMIADYSENRINDAGMTQILDAIRDNPNGLKDGLKQMVINYMKSHPEIAKEIVEEYLQHYDAENVREAYEALNTNPLRPQLKALLKQLLIASRPMAKEMALWFLETATAYDIQRTYETLQDIPDPTQQVIWNNVVDYVTDPDNRVVVYDLGVYFIKNITADQAGNAWNTLKTLNPDVKADFQGRLNYYIDQYINDPEHASYTTVTINDVDNVIDNYIEENPRIPVPTSCGEDNNVEINICNLKQLYEDIVEP